MALSAATRFGFSWVVPMQQIFGKKEERYSLEGEFSPEKCAAEFHEMFERKVCDLLIGPLVLEAVKTPHAIGAIHAMLRLAQAMELWVTKLPLCDLSQVFQRLYSLLHVCANLASDGEFVSASVPQLADFCVPDEEDTSKPRAAPSAVLADAVREDVWWETKIHSFKQVLMTEEELLQKLSLQSWEASSGEDGTDCLLSALSGKLARHGALLKFLQKWLESSPGVFETEMPVAAMRSALGASQSLKKFLPSGSEEAVLAMLDRGADCLRTAELKNQTDEFKAEISSFTQGASEEDATRVKDKLLKLSMDVTLDTETSKRFLQEAQHC